MLASRIPLPSLIGLVLVITGQHAFAAPIASGASFTGLGFLPERRAVLGDITPIGPQISADGSTVVGTFSATLDATDGVTRQAFRWTKNSGLEGLGDLPGGTFNSWARGVSADGSFIVGTGTGEFHEEAFKWSAEGGIEGLGFMGRAVGSEGTAISGDGSVIAGFGSNEPIIDQVAFRWTESEGMESLGSLADSGKAIGISSDGTTIVGFNGGLGEFREGFRWTESEGMVGLGSLSTTFPGSEAWDASEDGSVIVGYALRDFGDGEFRQQAFRWTEEGGMVGLGDIAGGTSSGNVGSRALGVSANGTTVVGNVVGFGRDGVDDVAFIWDEASQMRSLQDMLMQDLGLGDSLVDWRLTRATDISGDGSFIVGEGINPLGETEYWIANLGERRQSASVPLPGTIILLIVGLPAVARRIVCDKRQGRVARGSGVV